MSKWSDFCTTVGKYANRAVKKTEELADTASVHIKLKNLEVKLCEEYEKLGRLAYKKLKDESWSGAEEIAACLETIDGMYARQNELKAELEAIKAKGEEAQAPSEEAPAQEAPAEEAATEEEPTEDTVE